MIYRLRDKQQMLQTITVLAISTLAAPYCWAQDNKTTGDDTLEEIVVTGKFIATSGESGLKSDVPLRDVPLTVSSYTTDFMNAIETTRA